MTRRMARTSLHLSALVLAANLLIAAPAYADPLTFNIYDQAQFGTTVSGFLTFDPVGIYFAGPFRLNIGSIPTAGLPGYQFTHLNTAYVIQPNTSFHSLWVFDPSIPFNELFLLVSFDSCLSNGSCIFEMTYYQSPCSDCPPISRVQGTIVGSVVPEPASVWLLLAGLAALAAVRRKPRTD